MWLTWPIWKTCICGSIVTKKWMWTPRARTVTNHSSCKSRLWKLENIMTDPSADRPPQNGGEQSDSRQKPKAALTQEQLSAIADRVYGMLLRDLKQERERDR